jgi:hypothetical protein
MNSKIYIVAHQDIVVLAIISAVKSRALKFLINCIEKWI